MLSTSLTLLQRVRRRDDHAAWERFVLLYTPLLYRWTRLTGLSEQDAGDLIQDVFVILMTELPQFEYDTQRANFRGWLKTITVRKCREWQRRKVVGTPQGGDVDTLDQVPDDPVTDTFWEREYRECLVQRTLELMQSQFETRIWQACWETTVNEKSAAEAGRQLGMTEAAVYVAKFRVLRRLRQEVHGLME